MQLKGSCHCGAVEFSAVSYTFNPYMHCYCSICRKTAGGGGYAINILAQAGTLSATGLDNTSIYQVRLHGSGSTKDAELSPARRRFCKICGSALWVEDPRWPEWLYPFASAIDTPLPTPPERHHIMLDYVAPWVQIPGGVSETRHPEYPRESIVDWHKRHDLYG